MHPCCIDLLLQKVKVLENNTVSPLSDTIMTSRPCNSSVVAVVGQNLGLHHIQAMLLLLTLLLVPPCLNGHFFLL